MPTAPAIPPARLYTVTCVGCGPLLLDPARLGGGYLRCPKCRIQEWPEGLTLAMPAALPATLGRLL